MADIVQVKNLGDKPHRGRLNGQPYEIPADGRLHIMDREAAVKDFGNWEARNLSQRPKDRWRDKEVVRIRGLYGLHKGAQIPDRGPNGEAVLDESTGFPKEVFADLKVAEWLPKIEIYDMEGNRLTSIFDDPTGETLPLEGAAAEDVTKVVSSQADQLAAAQRQIDELRELVMETRTIQAPKDDPATASRPKGKKVEVTASQVARD